MSRPLSRAARAGPGPRQDLLRALQPDAGGAPDGDRGAWGSVPRARLHERIATAAPKQLAPRPGAPDRRHGAAQPDPRAARGRRVRGAGYIMDSCISRLA